MNFRGLRIFQGFLAQNVVPATWEIWQNVNKVSASKGSRKNAKSFKDRG